MVELEHLHHKDIPCIICFYINGKGYYWNGHTELMSVETGGAVSAVFPIVDGY